ncbi:MAG: ferritin family protein [Candidatus Sabulitectum sp.]|nr:ferritin family protein [Candidatus Sabulitectum sp.]
MKSWMSSDEILDFAIGEEEAAVKFYTGMAEKAEHSAMKRDFLLFANEERGHKAKLIAVKEGKKFKPSNEKVLDLKIADYTVDVDIDQVESYEDALVVAMKKEKAAYKLYTKLSEMVETEDAKNLFNSLAQEEAKHKLRFEIAYDDMLKEN